MNVRHSSETNEHFTPKYIVDIVRTTLGGVIDLDPASCDSANQVVRAHKIYTKDDNGLAKDKDWVGNVFLNPPGGRVGKQSRQNIFWQKLVREYEANNVSEAVFLSFSVELLQTSQTNPAGRTPHDFPICFPSRRIAYTQEDGTTGASPPHSSMLVYLGRYPDKFVYATAGLGRVMGPWM